MLKQPAPWLLLQVQQAGAQIEAIQARAATGVQLAGAGDPGMDEVQRVEGQVGAAAL